MYFVLRIWEKIMSDGIRRGRCCIALWSSTSTRFLFANSATVVEKFGSLDQDSFRDSYTASVKRERLFSQSEESLQETTSFIFIAS